MKKAIAILLALVMIMGMCVSLCACGDNKDDYVGVWKVVDEESNFFNYYFYIYKDGTADSYGRYGHSRPFTWEVEDGYLVINFSNYIEKYTLSGDQLLDKQGKVWATKYSSDTSVDVSLY